MKTGISKVGAIAMAVITLFAAGSIQAEDPATVLDDFEAYAAGSPPSSPWQFSPETGHNLVVTNTAAHGGSQSLASVFVNAGYSYDKAIYPVMIPPGASASFSVWIRTGAHTANYEGLGAVGVYELDTVSEYWYRPVSVQFENSLGNNGTGGSTQFSLVCGEEGTRTGDFSPLSWYRVDCTITPDDIIFVTEIDTGTVTNTVPRYANYRIDQIILQGAGLSTAYFDDFSYTPPVVTIPVPELTGFSAYGADSAGFFDGNSYYDTVAGNGTWNAYLFTNSPASPGWLHSGNSNLDFSYAFSTPGEHTLYFAGDYVSGHTHVGINLFFDGDYNANRITAVQARDNSSAFAVVATNITTFLGGPSSGSGPGSGSLVFDNGRYTVELTGFTITNGLDLVDAYDTTADGTPDTVGVLTFTVTDNTLPPPVALDVYSDHGSPAPAAGPHEYTSGSVVTCSVENVTVGLTNYSCIGWIGSGSVPASGSSNEVVFAIDENSSITWNWQTNYWLDVSVSGSGSVNQVSGWYEKGEVLELIQFPVPGWLFLGWSGDASGTNQYLLFMTEPKTVTAIFSDDADGDGLTNNEEDAIGSNPWKTDTDGDGFDDKTEVDYGLSPTADSSGLITYIQNNDQTFGLYPSNVVLDVALGEMLLDVIGAEATLSLQLETSDDLNTWSNAGPAQVWSWTVDGEKKFFRVKSSR